MDSQGYGLLVEENEDDANANDKNEQKNSHSSQQTEVKSNVNDCDIVTCSSTSMPHLSETEEGDNQNKDLQEYSNSDEPPLIESR